MASSYFAQFHAECIQQNNIKKILDYFEQNHQWHSSIVLFMLWHIKSHLGRITASQLKQLHHDTKAWHTRITKPLSKLHGTLSSKQQHDMAKEVQHILKLGMAYEIQTLESTLPSLHQNKRTDTLLINDACQNIVVYCKQIPSKFAQDDIGRIRSLLTEIFSQHDPKEIEHACQTHIGAYFLNQPPTYEQLLLEEL